MENSFCSRTFQFLGVHPDKSLKKWLCFFNISVIICLIFLTILKYYHDKDSGAVEAISSLVIVIIKYPMLIFGSKIINQILKAREQFWKLDVIDERAIFYWNHFKRIEGLLKPTVMLGAVMYALKPFVITGSSIFNCYIFPEIPLQIYYILEFYVVIISSSLLVSFNIFVCCLIISVVIQFRYLNLKIEALKFKYDENDLDPTRFQRDLTSLTRYQQFLMRYVEDLNKLLSVPLALLMVSCVSLVCMNMYIISTNESSIIDNVKIVITSLLVIFEFFMVYGLPAQLLMDESTATADAIYYECNWYSPKLRPFRKNFLFMILRSQKGVCIRAGNYHVINNNTIVAMLKTAYSFYTFLQNVA